jgi:putative two-component system response regulator
LVVDDVQTNLAITVEMLKPYCVTVDTLTDAMKAVSVIRAGEPKYDLVLMDYLMPGLDGVEAVQAIRNEIGTAYAKSLPIVALTGNRIVGNDAMFLRHGFQDAMSKPIDANRLDEILRKWVLHENPENTASPALATHAEPAVGFDIPGVDCDRGLLRFGGNDDAWRGVLASFVDHATSLLARIRTAPGEKELQEYATVIHGIKGAALGICANSIGIKAGALQTAAEDGRIAFVRDYHDRFVTEVGALVASVSAALAAARSPEPEMAEERKAKIDAFAGEFTKSLHSLASRRQQRIVLVDDNLTNLAIVRNMLNTLYRLHTVATGEMLFELLENIAPAIPDLILLDIETQGSGGFETLKALKANPKYRWIPVIFLTAQKDELCEMEGLALGAVDYVYKPLSAPLLQRRIENHLLIAKQNQTLHEQAEDLERLANSLHDMVVQKTEQVVGLQNAVLGTVAELIEFRDDVTGDHVVRTQKFLKLLIGRMEETGLYRQEVEEWNLELMIPSAQLHDVGKIAISDAILNKPARLTPAEFEIMKTHTTIGVEIIERIAKQTEDHELLRYAKRIAGTHHEKWDGSGYPYGLVGTTIPLEGRLMAIVDVYDALISKRPYKNAYSPRDAEQIILEGSCTHFDPELVRIFSDVSDQFASIATESGGAGSPGRPGFVAVLPAIGRVAS